MWSDLKALEVRLKNVAAKVRHLSQPLPATGRETIVIVQQEIAVNSYDLSEQQATFVNGDRDTIVIPRLGVSVRQNQDPSTEPNQRLAMQRVPEGWKRRTATVAGADFEFLWNYLVQSRQSLYCRDFVSSECLVGFDKGKMLDLRVPLVIPPGESVTFFVRPLMFPIPTTSEVPTVGGIIYYPSFIGLGYRRPA